MRAARLHAYHEALKLDEVDEPKVTGPLDVIVRIGAAGLCRTDLHIQEGQWAEMSQVELPYTPGPRERRLGPRDRLRRDQRRGRRHGDRASVHHAAGCAGPAGAATTCTARTASFPGIDSDGGFAEFMLTSARSVVKLDPSLHPTQIAALADAGLTAIHAVKKAIPVLGRRHARRGDRRRRARPHRHPVPEGLHADRDHRHRPEREGAGAGGRAGRRPHRQGRRHAARQGQRDHRRRRRRGDHRLRRREGRHRGRRSRWSTTAASTTSSATARTSTSRRST